MHLSTRVGNHYPLSIITSHEKARLPESVAGLFRFPELLAGLFRLILFRRYAIVS
jgi:hypothetical protein